MFELVVALAFVALLVLLPLTTSMRVLRVSREIDELRQRIALLESQLREVHTRPAPPVAPSPIPSPLSEPVDTGAVPEPFPPPVETPAPVPLPTPVTATSSEDQEDLEGRIGGRWLLYTGVLVLLLGVSFFLKYAFDNEWINETGRVLSGSFAGIALIAGGIRLARRDLAIFGQALIGTGLAILYLAIYAALMFYELIGTGTAFALMFAVTVASALLADRQRSQALAFIAVGGGFATPFLVGRQDDAQLALFSYDAILVAGTMVLARRHDWFALNAVSYALTLATVVAWAAAHYSDRTWLRTFLFLTLFCIMFVQILRDTRRAGTTVARLVAALLMTAPLFYHIAAVVITARHPPGIHIYIIAITAVGLWLTADPHRPAMRLVVLVASYLPLLGELTLPNGLSWLMANTVTIIAVAALHLLAILDRVFRQEQRLATADLVALHVASIGLFGLLYQTLQPAYPEFRGTLAAILAIGAIILWQVLQRRDMIAALNAAAVAFTLTALAIAVQFDGRAIVVGWAAEGAAATWVGLRVRSLAFQGGGQLLWALAVLRLLDGYFATPVDFTALLNERALATLFVVVLGYTLAWLFKQYGDPAGAGRTRAGLHLVASMLTMLWITAEVGSYWEVRSGTPQAYLYRQLNLLLGWGIYGAVLIVSGMRRAYAPDRYIGMTVLAITILKVFFYDLWELGGIYRVIAFIVFGVLLMAVSFLYQKRKGARRSEAARLRSRRPFLFNRRRAPRTTRAPRAEAIGFATLTAPMGSRSEKMSSLDAADRHRRGARRAGPVHVDLNSDLGESFGPWPMGQDEALMSSITSANVACGFHAGDPGVMRHTIALAKQHGVAVGAHPGFPDLVGFGRREMQASPREVEDYVLYQISALAGMAATQGVRLQHVKAHGALYNQACRDASLAEAIARAVAAFDSSLILLGLPGSALLRAGQQAGLRVAAEVFADRSYDADGSLTSRRKPGAVLHDPAEVVSRAVRMVRERKVIAIDGAPVGLDVDTICLHGDTPGSAELARKVKQGLVDAGVSVGALQTTL